VSPPRAEVGRTKDAGWQIGVSKTVDHPIGRVWDLLISARGTAVWLGHGVTLGDEPGEPYKTAEGTVGEVRSFRPKDRIRLTWQPKGWDHETTVQVAVTSSGKDKTMLRFHQEHLTSAVERDQQRIHWRAVMASIVKALDS
jgi:uncharacterized protein YndB with AHSA1/START domain